MNKDQIDHIIQCLSGDRLSRYVKVCNGNRKQAIKLYRINLRLSVECFCLICHFEVVLRNAIYRHYAAEKNNPKWLEHAIRAGGMYSSASFEDTQRIVSNAAKRLGRKYSASELVPALDLGFWRHQFKDSLFRAGGKSLLRIFPHKPSSSPRVQYNHTYVFKQLAKINALRNRIAHHEPLCFVRKKAVIDLSDVEKAVLAIYELTRWLGVNKAVIGSEKRYLNKALRRIKRFK